MHLAPQLSRAETGGGGMTFGGLANAIIRMLSVIRSPSFGIQLARRIGMVDTEPWRHTAALKEEDGFCLQRIASTNRCVCFPMSFYHTPHTNMQPCFPFIFSFQDIYLYRNNGQWVTLDIALPQIRRCTNKPNHNILTHVLASFGGGRRQTTTQGNNAKWRKAMKKNPKCF